MSNEELEKELKALKERVKELEEKSGNIGARGGVIDEIDKRVRELEAKSKSSR